LASSVPNSVPQKWRRPVRQRSRLVKRTGPAHARVEFAHPSEQEFARFLDYYRIRWVYEPMSFPIGWEGERVSEMFTPDFYLPEHDLYIELTTMKQSLVTPKNRKVRLLRELYPELNVRLLYRKDYQQLLAKAGYGAVEVQNLRKQDIGEILISPVELETRVKALARKISRDYRGQSLVVVGVLKGVTFFLADLARGIKVPFVLDYLDLRRYAGAQPHDRVRIARDIDYPIAGRHVLLVEDIVNTGLTLDMRYTKFNSAFGQGSYEFVSLSRTLAERFHVQIQGGMQHLTSAFSSNSDSKFVSSTVDWSIGPRYFFEGLFSWNMGTSMNYQQTNFTFGYRFGGALRK